MKTTIENGMKEGIILWTPILGAVGLKITDINTYLTTISLSMAIIITVYNQYQKYKKYKKRK